MTLVVAAVAIFGVCESPRAATANPIGPCQQAMDLVAAGQFAQALTTLGQALPTDEACALRGFATAQATSGSHACARGDALFAAGDYANARASYVEALERDPSCATSGFRQLQLRAAGIACRQGQALHGADDDADAKTAFKTAIDGKPDSKCGIDGLAGVDTEDFWDGVARWTARILGVVGAIALGILLLALAWFSVKAAWTRMRRPAPQLQIKAFDDTALNAKLGPSFAELLRSDLIAPASFGPQIDIVTGEAAGVDALDALSDALPDTAKPLTGLLAAVRTLEARKQATLSGALHPSGELGFGVSVAMASATAYNVSDDLWTTQFPLVWRTEEASIVQGLAAPAAGYTRHAYTHQYVSSRRFQRRKHRGEFHQVMGSDPFAFALFRTAQDRAAVGDTENALALCEAGLDRAGDFALGLALRGELLGITGDEDQSILVLTAAFNKL